MTTKLLNTPQDLKERRQFGFKDDFEWLLSPHRWTAVLSDSGSAVVGSSPGGVVTLTPSDESVSDNDEAYLRSTNPVFKFAALKPLVAEILLQFTEANTNAANLVFGVTDQSGADVLANNGGGLASSYYGALFFKTDGGTRWQCESSRGSTQTTTDLLNTSALDQTTHTAGGTAYQRLTIEFIPHSDSAAEVLFYIDGCHVATHQYTFTSATAMYVVAGVKNGSTSLETLNIDYIAAYQLR